MRGTAAEGRTGRTLSVERPRYRKARIQQRDERDRPHHGLGGLPHVVLDRRRFGLHGFSPKR